MQTQVAEQMPTIGLNITLGLLGISLMVGIIFVVGFIKFIKKE